MTKSRGLRVPKGTRPRWVAENQGRFICQCGCKRLIRLKPEHYPNAPRFVLGHNQLGTVRVQKPPAMPCKCGCGKVATSGKRFVSGHNGRGIPRSPETKAKISEKQRGDLNGFWGKRAWNFKGRIYHADGYVLIWSPEHPFASNGRVFEHRLFVEQHLRETDATSPYLVRLGEQLYLSPEAEIHHRDGVKDNNALDNLLPLTKVEHATLHAQMKRLR